MALVLITTKVLDPNHRKEPLPISHGHWPIAKRLARIISYGDRTQI